MEHSDTMVGTCMSMCSDAEMSMREREGLLHPMESIRTQNSMPDTTTRRTSFGKSPSKLLLRADPTKVVKEYSRSAAGRSDLDPCNVRPASVLKHTMLYLLNNLTVLESPDWIEVYDFVFDRIRAVRQDMTIQGIVGRDAITILEQTVRFHAYASYRLRNYGMCEYDPAINKHHLLECLKELLCLYQTTDGPHENQAEFEAVYLCDSLGNSEAITHCLSLPAHIRNHPLVETCLRASLSVLLRNYARALRLIHTVQCPVCLCVISYHLDHIRIGYLQILSHGYSVKNCQFPVDNLSSLLYLPSANVAHDGAHTNGGGKVDTPKASTATTSAWDLCSSCHLVDWFSNSQSSKDYVSFNKTKFTWPSERRPSPPWAILDKVLNCSSLSHILVYGQTECGRDYNNHDDNGRPDGRPDTSRNRRIRGRRNRGIADSVNENNTNYAAIDKSNSNNCTDIIVKGGVGEEKEEEGVDGLTDRLQFVSLVDRQKKEKDEESDRRSGSLKGVGVLSGAGIGGGGRGEKEREGVNECRGRGRGKRKKKQGGGGRENYTVDINTSIGGGGRKGFSREMSAGQIQIDSGNQSSLEYTPSRGRGRGRGRGKKSDIIIGVVEGETKGKNKKRNDEDRQRKKEEADNATEASWEDWSEENFSLEMKDRLENV